MIDIEDALLMRAEFCGGFIPLKEYNEIDMTLTDQYYIIQRELNSDVYSYAVNAEAGMWQALFARETYMRMEFN